MIAALFVEESGPYADVEDVEVWGVGRDARGYRGPHVVVAHPPCKRWGRYWSGGPSASVRRLKGDDDGCFASALWSVRTFGGVLEHPEASHAWGWFGLGRPAFLGGWTEEDAFGGRSCCVAQGHYGHSAQKMTWLYAVGLTDTPDLVWGRCPGRNRIDPGFHVTPAVRPAPCERLSSRQRILTPEPFRDLLLLIAEGCR